MIERTKWLHSFLFISQFSLVWSMIVAANYSNTKYVVSHSPVEHFSDFYRCGVSNHNDLAMFSFALLCRSSRSPWLDGHWPCPLAGLPRHIPQPNKVITIVPLMNVISIVILVTFILTIVINIFSFNIFSYNFFFLLLLLSLLSLSLLLLSLLLLLILIAFNFFCQWKRLSK